MPRAISKGNRSRINVLISTHPDAVGPRLGRIAFTYKIPVTALAGLIGVSSATVYRWFYGEAEPRMHNVPQIAKVLRVLKYARDVGALPLHGTEAQRTAELREILLKHRPSTPAEIN